MSKKSWWSTERPVDEIIPDNARPQRGKKDTRRWCKGKVGREHTPETVRHHFYAAAPFAVKECGWQEYWSYRGSRELRDRRWRCLHAIQCSTCGKYLNMWLGREQCPDAPGEGA